jgi:hypothetical protein
MNLQKYRLMEYRNEKEREKASKKMAEESHKFGYCLQKSDRTENTKHAKAKVTRKTHKHLFSFLKEEEEGEEAIKQLRKKFA